MKRESKVSNYKEITDIPDKLKIVLPTSFDVIGDIALIKIPKELYPYKNKISQAFLQTYKHIKTVCLSSPVSGELRIRDIEIIGGENKLETIHKEYGAKFKLDIKKVYFSPRLATERKRIADLVKENEVIIDMFTGVAPFPIVIAKHANPRIIYGIEKNKNAFFYAKENVKLNKLLDKIEIFNDDAKNVDKIFEDLNIKADRIIMNLPFSAQNFFKKALMTCNSPSVIHYYDFLKDEEIEDKIKILQEHAKVVGYNLDIERINKIKSYSPREFYIGIDITAKKK